MTTFSTEFTRQCGVELPIVAGALMWLAERNTVRTLANETTEAVIKLETENPNITLQELMPYVSGQIGRNAYKTADVSKGLLSAGHALGLTDKIEPMADIFRRIESEARTAMDRLQLCTTKGS